jgi:hypothetical protein
MAANGPSRITTCIGCRSKDITATLSRVLEALPLAVHHKEDQDKADMCAYTSANLLTLLRLGKYKSAQGNQ